MRNVASFDFDGTLTTRDTLFEFIRYVKGTPRTLFGILLFAPLMVIAILAISPLPPITNLELVSVIGPIVDFMSIVYSSPLGFAMAFLHFDITSFTSAGI